MVDKTRCMIVCGTRPEVIKLAPIALAMKEKRELFDCALVFTGQHRELGQQALDMFGLIADIDLNLMEEGQQVTEFLGRALIGLDQTVRACRPHWVIVQGDTGSALAGAISGFNRKIRVAHVEAGLRTYDLSAPHPEEGNRQMISRIASLHLAPTQRARAMLLHEHIPDDKILVTGNTVVDAVRWIGNQLRPMGTPLVCEITSGAASKLVLTTIHRRESFGAPLVGMLEAIKTLALDPALGLTFLFPVHPNPQIEETVNAILGHQSNVKLLPPLDYKTTLGLMSLSWLVLTDSGGLQEEAPCFSVPVFVLRNVTERTEGVDAGIAELIGTDKNKIIEAVRVLVYNEAAYAKMCSGDNPYGNGRAAQIILERLQAKPE
jgi:UDP-N-acetylglucosamine 2-epimerase (non-hydrolysing)